MKTLVVFLFFLFTLLVGCDGKGDDRIIKIRNKRSDGLIRDLLHQMVSEHLERRKILKEFQTMKTKLDEVKRSHLKLKNTLSKDLIIKLLKDIKAVKAASKADIKKDLQRVNRKVERIERRDKFLSNKISNTNNVLNRISKTVDDTTKRLSGVEKRCDLISKKVENRMHDGESHRKQIVFSTRLTKTTYTSSVLVFGHVITNIGGGYNASDGKFYCPKDGLYLFSVTLEGHKRFNVWAELMKNNYVLAHFHERGVTGGYPSASVTVAGKLVSGDQVWVRGVGIYYRPYSYFTGVYIGT